MEDAHGTALTNAARPRRRWWACLRPPAPVLVAWLAAFPAAWGTFAALDRVLPQGPPSPGWLLDVGLGLPMAAGCCGAPFVGGALALYAMLRHVHARVRLYTLPLFVVCFVGAFCRDGPIDRGANGVLATVVAAGILVGEALVRRSKHEAVTALVLLAAAVLELHWWCALAMVASI